MSEKRGRAGRAREESAKRSQGRGPWFTAAACRKVRQTATNKDQRRKRTRRWNSEATSAFDAQKGRRAVTQTAKEKAGAKAKKRLGGGGGVKKNGSTNTPRYNIRLLPKGKESEGNRAHCSRNSGAGRGIRPHEKKKRDRQPISEKRRTRGAVDINRGRVGEAADQELLTKKKEKDTNDLGGVRKGTRRELDQTGGKILSGEKEGRQ